MGGSILALMVSMICLIVSVSAICSVIFLPDSKVLLVWKHLMVFP